MAPNKENTFIMHPLKMKAKARTLRARAGLIFPGYRIYRKLKSGFYAPRIAKDAAIFVAAVLEYLAIEILELAGNAAAQNRKKRISPRHILLAIRNDDELNQMLKDVIILQGGVIPHIDPQLLPKKIFIQKYTSTNDSDTFSQEY